MYASVIAPVLVSLNFASGDRALFGVGGMDFDQEQAGIELTAGFKLDSKERESFQLNRPVRRFERTVT